MWGAAGGGQQHPDHEDGPDEVELLLGRERPEVLDGRRRVLGGEVVDGECARCQFCTYSVLARMSPRNCSQLHSGTKTTVAPAHTASVTSEAGQDAPCAARPERGQRERPVRSTSRRSSDVIRKPEIDEEHVDADEAAGQRPTATGDRRRPAITAMARRAWISGRTAVEDACLVGLPSFRRGGCAAGSGRAGAPRGSAAAAVSASGEMASTRQAKSEFSAQTSDQECRAAVLGVLQRRCGEPALAA